MTALRHIYVLQQLFVYDINSQRLHHVIVEFHYWKVKFHLKMQCEHADYVLFKKFAEDLQKKFLYVVSGMVLLFHHAQLKDGFLQGK